MNLQEYLEEDRQHLWDADASREAMVGQLINPDYVARGVWKIEDLYAVHNS